MTDYALIDEPDTVIAVLDRQDRIGVDTEFMREKTFFAELCLVQISAADQIFCIDPLSGKDLQTFWASTSGTTWVLHSARQDIEVVYQTAQSMPRAIFDTQIAAGLLGFPPQLGYANLVNELFAVELPKTHTRADWSRRPLAAELLQYAAEDVLYLLPAFETLAERLEKAGRLAWAEEDSAQLLDPALYDLDPQLAIDRLKGSGKLHGRSRAAAAHLAAWRETEALRANRPRQWIAKDAVLIGLARALPDTLDALQSIDGLSPGLIRRSGKRILDAVAASRSDDNDHRPAAAPDEAQKAALRQMQAAVAACANDLGIAAETVAAKKDLLSLLGNGDRESRLLKGWRHELIGEQLLQMA